jgi:hypothetical protein
VAEPAVAEPAIDRDKAFHRLEQRLKDIAEIANDPEQSQQLLQKLLTADPMLRSFLTRTLGVVGGAFGIADPDSGAFFLLQTNKVRDTRILCIDIPAAETQTAGSAAAMMEVMALSRRSGVRVSEAAPEFIHHLLSPDGDLAYASDLECSTALPWTALYCGVGEIALFCLLWRILLMLGERAGFSTPLVQAIQEGPRVDQHQRWWETKWTTSLPERDWATFLNGEQSSLMLTPELEQAARDQWAAFGPVEATLAGPWDSAVDEQARAIGLHVPLYDQMLKNYTKFVSKNMCDDLRATLLQTIMEALKLPDESVEAALAGLHRVARFPILPMYYLSVLYKTPICHIVLQLWQSTRNPVKVFSNRRVIHSPTVIWGLLACRPPTLEDYVGPVSRQLRDLQLFFRLVVTPIVDQGFYDGLVRQRLRSSERLQALDAIAHDVRKYFNGLECNWWKYVKNVFGFSRGAHDDDYFGQLLTDSDDEEKRIAKMAIVPVPSMLKDVGKSLSLWTITSIHQVLNDHNNLQPVTSIEFDHLLKKAFDFACRSTIPLAFSGIDFGTEESHTSLSLIVERVTTAIANFQKLLQNVRPQTTDIVKIPIAADRNEQSILHLWRALTLMLQSSIQHGSMFAPITVSLRKESGREYYRLAVTNRTAETEGNTTKQIADQFQLELESEDLEILTQAVFARRGPTAQDARDRVLLHTGEILQACAQELEGERTAFGRQDDGTFLAAIRFVPWWSNR